MKLSLSFLALGALVLASPEASPELDERSQDEQQVIGALPFHEPNYPAKAMAIPSEDLGMAYASGAVHMSLMTAFTESINSMAMRGIFDEPSTHKSITRFTPCVNGYAGSEVNNTFSCSNLDLYTFVAHEHLGSDKKQGSDIWGWTKDGREFGLVGQWEGTAFVEIMKETGAAVYLGRLPTQSVGSLWRDIKVIGDHAYIGSEAEGHGVQVFDLTKLLDENLAMSPKNFSIKHDLTAWHDLPVGRSHNIVSHAEKNLIAAVGSVPRDDECRAGLIFIDVTDPSNPKSAGCASEDGYVHDAQCLTYHGPHDEYDGRDVCYSFNEDSFTIYDITEPSEPVIISSTGYYGASYSHQGWVIDESDQRYVLLDDELDEMNRTGWAYDERTVTYIWDIQNLSAPVLTGHYKSPAKAIDHNLYVKDGLAYESNYGSGLRVVNVSSVVADPTGAGFSEIAFFDVHPEDDDENGKAEFCGSWSVYPYFESGFLLVNSIERGLFVLKLAGAA